EAVTDGRGRVGSRDRSGSVTDRLLGARAVDPLSGAVARAQEHPLGRGVEVGADLGEVGRAGCWRFWREIAHPSNGIILPNVGSICHSAWRSVGSSYPYTWNCQREPRVRCQRWIANAMKPKDPSFHEKMFGTDMDATISAAWLYYHHKLTQAEIAKQLHVSRPTVANLLSRARSRGIVSISLRPDLLSRLSLAEELRVRFALQDACLVPPPEGATSLEIRQALGKAGALYLESTLQPGE